MMNVIYLRFKQYYFVLGLCAVILVLSMMGIIKGDIIGTIVACFFLYKVNVEEKVKKNWDYFQSLPLSLAERSLIQIVIPFLLVVMIFFITEKNFDLLFVIDGSLTKTVLASLLVVMSSVIARSLWGFVGIYFLTSLLVRPILAINGGFALALAVAAGISVLALSEYRLSRNKVLLTSAGVGLVLMMICRFSTLPLYRSLLESPKIAVSSYAAQELIEDYDDNEAMLHLRSRIFTINSADRLDDIFDALEDSKVTLDLPVASWQEFVRNSDPELQEEILDYLRGDYDKYTWISYESLKDIEDSIWARRKSCDGACHELAMLVADTKDIDWDRMNAYIESGNKEKIDYVLEVLEHSEVRALEEKVIALLEHNNENIREASLELLNEWSDKAFRHKSKEYSKLFSEKMTEEMRKKAQEHYRKALLKD